MGVILRSCDQISILLVLVRQPTRRGSTQGPTAASPPKKLFSHDILSTLDRGH